MVTILPPPVRRAVVALRPLARPLSAAAAAQVCTLLAMVAPIALHQDVPVLVLVYASSISIVLVYGSLLAFPNVYPVLRGPHVRRVATALTRVSLVTVSLLLLPLGLFERQLGMPSGTFVVTAALLFGQGSYLLEVTRLIRAGDVARVATARLVYAVVLLVVSVAVSLMPIGHLALTLGNAGSYCLGALTARAGRGLPARGTVPWFRRSSYRLARAYLRRAFRPTLAMVAGGWTNLLPGLALPGLGAAAAPWAVTTRICGGFASIATTIVIPLFDARLSAAVRDRKPEAYLRTRRTAMWIGVALALVAVPAGVGLAVYDSPSHPQAWLAPVAAAAALFWLGSMVSLMLGRLPSFLGRDGQRLAWDGGRAALMTVAFLATDGTTRLLVMGAVLAVSTVWLLPLSRPQARRRSAVPAAQPGDRPAPAVPAVQVGL